MSKKQKRMLFRVLASAVLFAVALLLPTEGWLRLFTFLIPYAVIAWDVLWRAVRNIAHGQVFDENFLMSLATVGALATGEYPEAVFVMLFYQVGELFQSYAVDQSRKSITSLMDIRPDYANIEVDGQLRQVDPEDVAVGDTIVIKAGERIPLDGVVLEGTSNVDTAALTGESLPREAQPGDDVISGCVNLSGLLRVRVTKAFEESTVAKILDLVENSSSKKAKAENFITKFARYYTPAVVLAAVALALLPPLFTSIQWVDSIQRALNFLVVSCPCALVISVPLSFFGGIGGASKNGILVKGGNYLEVLAKTELVVFDKTGTLTRGVFNVTAIHPDHCGEAQLLELAALAESYSDHPISRSLKEAYGKELDTSRVSNVEELSGRGVRATVDGRQICAGNDKLMEDIGVSWHPCHRVGTTVHVASDGVYLGHIVISDEVKPDAKEAITALKACGVRRTVMLTGDAKAVGESVAQELGLDEVHTQLLPADKVTRVEALLGEVSPKGALAFVGDGINDAPVLSRADIGIAMGGLGSDAAIEAADIVLMDDKPSKLADAIRIARRTLAIVRQNIVFALAVKFLVLALSAAGAANMWEAVFADVGVSVIAILNAMRALKTVK
ncbi:cadmium-translocating P-type ATPase [Flavonifractor plautii]|uniref:Cd(2+)-exporting ATPase n=1 Tax=Flavonifractor plautii TaxID=292800 RepID=A0AAX1KIB5_FLAPL|nr:heavy metal translocating P-type ATPase [Flavonifractor plautii]ANU41470.1 cadmium-translocating P-type ATPase [Flavonifractor plautii]MBM6789868.1 cadmium-translocating P-type ATPase [Flavonifractor plautii]MDU3011264.1 heavy metal translocating P-type ATPase [Flavonifractor plautii]OXE49297.1 cadmium-translocating P-type ATPase [Flavonifractor plautii]QQR05674.1 cadmium-translocating P-type ATPase [Flavonifractor plautii]